jgi:hypothetical protein
MTTLPPPSPPPPPPLPTSSSANNLVADNVAMEMQMVARGGADNATVRDAESACGI